MIESLSENGIPVYLILGDHDRHATGGDVFVAADAISALESLTEAGTATCYTLIGTRHEGSNLRLFGINATNIGFTEIKE